MRILVIAEHDHQNVKSSTLNTLQAASSLNFPIDVLVAGNKCGEVAQQVSILPGVTRVYIADVLALHAFLAEPMTETILTIAKEYSHILAPATTFGKNILPRVAAKLDVMQLSDVTKISDAHTVERPIYAGNALATVQSLDDIKVISVRPTAFPIGHSDFQKRTQAALIQAIDVPNFPPYPLYIGCESAISDRPNLANARVVVSGGRGLQSRENFRLIEELADCLHGAIGASRAAVDAGFISNDHQVGQTGKVVAPDLYIAIGISGAIQHLAGMKESKVVIAINKDPDAAIFQIADYGLVGDLFDIVPQLIQAFRKE